MIVPANVKYDSGTDEVVVFIVDPDSGEDVDVARIPADTDAHDRAEQAGDAQARTRDA